MSTQTLSGAGQRTGSHTAGLGEYLTVGIDGDFKGVVVLHRSRDVSPPEELARFSGRIVHSQAAPTPAEDASWPEGAEWTYWASIPKGTKWSGEAKVTFSRTAK